jgi:hypothetical protein
MPQCRRHVADVEAFEEPLLFGQTVIEALGCGSLYAIDDRERRRVIFEGGFRGVARVLQHTLQIRLADANVAYPRQNFARGTRGGAALMDREVAEVTLVGSRGLLKWMHDGTALRVELPGTLPSSGAFSIRVLLRDADRDAQR